MDMEKVSGAGWDEAWIGELTRRFTEVAARRVNPASIEDLVQDALRVVIEKGGDRPRLDWCFQVLRNVIGNHYQREKTRRRFVVPDPEREADAAATEVTALEAMEGQELVDLLRTGVGTLGEPCSNYLGRLMVGESPARISTEEGLEAAVFYRRLYRCRQKLREWLKSKGVEA